MFGKRNLPPSEKAGPTPVPDVGSAGAESAQARATPSDGRAAPASTLPATTSSDSRSASPRPASASQVFGGGEERYAEIKGNVFSALVEAVDLTELSKLSSVQVREEITDIVGEIIAMQNQVLSAAEQQKLINDICNDVLGLGPLEPLLARDDIADIMVNGADQVYIETEGLMEHTDIHFT